MGDLFCFAFEFSGAPSFTRAGQRGGGLEFSYKQYKWEIVKSLGNR